MQTDGFNKNINHQLTNITS